MSDDAPTSPKALSPNEKQQVSKLVETRFKGYASARLAKLSEPVLNELVRMCSSPKDDPVTTTEEKVGRILEAKKELQKEARRTETRCETPAPPPAYDSPPPSIPEEPPDPPETPPPPKITAAPPSPATKIVRPVFKTQHEINIIAFNSLKLRLDREELEDEWDAAVLEFSKYDVLMLSEVRASDALFKKRAVRLVEMLNDCSESKWGMSFSDPCGPGAKEVHLVIAKHPIGIIGVGTLTALDGMAMDHAPIVATLEDIRFTGELKRINVVSVHMPPKSNRDRRAARDAQIRKLAATYAAEASARLGQPFTNQAAKELRKKASYVAHVIGGDFNADAKELRDLDVERHGWEIVLGSVRTSSGGKSYDNWLINRDCKDHLTVGADVLDLTQYANFSRGQQGISDHAPIALRLREVPRMNAPAVAQTRASMRKAKVEADTAAYLKEPNNTSSGEAVQLW